MEKLKLFEKKWKWKQMKYLYFIRIWKDCTVLQQIKAVSLELDKNEI